MVYKLHRQHFLLKLCFAVFLASLVVGTPIVHAPYADDGRLFPLASPIKVTSPSNTTYSSGLLMLDVSFKLMLNIEKTNITVFYCLDGKENVSFPVSAEFFPVETTVTYEKGTTVTGVSSIFSYYILRGSVALPELSEGFHRILVYGRYEHVGGSNFSVFDNASVHFTVNDGSAPIISNLSVENKTYSQDELNLSFTVDESALWMGYCLDRQANVTFNENFTITKLSPGSHTLNIYANDTVGNMGASETVCFTIIEPFPTSLVVTSVFLVAIIVIGVGMLIYGIKRR